MITKIKTIAPPKVRGTGIKAIKRFTKNKKIIIPIINSRIPIYYHLLS